MVTNYSCIDILMSFLTLVFIEINDFLSDVVVDDDNESLLWLRLAKEP